MSRSPMASAFRRRSDNVDNSRMRHARPCCMRSICARLTGRDGGVLDEDVCPAPNVLDRRCRASVHAKSQIVTLREQCNALAAMLPETIPSQSIDKRVASREALVTIQDRLAALEDLIAASSSQEDDGAGTQTSRSVAISVASTSSRPDAIVGARLRDVVPCKVAEGDSPGKQWSVGRLFLSDLGLSFRLEASNSNTYQDVFWTDVRSIVCSSPKPSSRSHRFFGSRQNGSGVCGHVVEMKLSTAPGQLDLEFRVQQPVELMKTLWANGRDDATSVSEHTSPETSQAIESEDPSDHTTFVGCPVLKEFRQCGGLPAGAEHKLIYSGVMEHQSTLEAVRHQFMRNDDRWPVARAWQEDMNATVFNLSSWEPLAGGHGFLRRIHMRLPLKPMPLAPKSTRITIVFCITLEGDRAFTLSEESLSFDVPYWNCFRVQGTTRFEYTPDRGIQVFKKLGARWSQRVMLKSLIEKTSRSEGQTFFNFVMNRLRENLSADGREP